MSVKMVRGIPASPGIAIAKAYVMESHEPVIEKESALGAEAELERLEAAVAQSSRELEEIREHTAAELGEEEAKIFEAHLLVLQDPELLGPVRDKIRNEAVTAEFALRETAREIAAAFEALGTEYLRERAADIRDVTRRVLAALSGEPFQDLGGITEEVIIVAHDLTPSDTARLNRTFVKGFTISAGSRTSHSAIMARSMGIPAIVGSADVMESVRHNDLLILDGHEGVLLVNPSRELVAEYEDRRREEAQKKREWALLVGQPTVTGDGQRVLLAGNIGSPADAAEVIECGGEGIGLFRTEFLYMGRTDAPSEEEQFSAYRQVLETMAGKPVIVRTIDIGGDKEAPCLNLPREDNPFLGFRAIRLCLDSAGEELFRTQLRALLRASVYGRLHIMFPMIAALEELRRAKQMLAEEKRKLLAEGAEVSDNVSVGMMVEIPSVAVMADLFAPEVDFFSIGTNDLIQYTMAADRMNGRVSHLYQPFNPAVLRLIAGVIDAAHAHGKWVGMCGEMAGDRLAVPLLLGLGLDEFSMSAASILPARSLIRSLSRAEMAVMAQQALRLADAREVADFVRRSVNAAVVSP
ncbi:phosphoenolpyruvate--protein phosphotransferase [Paenibacillus phoenicis]|uniref:Phosphoenolpyruvate-protein phosphotransferase n=1 Tax=Paenibacillus phoenicis TaxID=554117 RepID=A0ABU5PPY4_9BACL|nr:phosphoenolpyruvate--protein phosphotransferase [Paenibacillus phoenicis]MEA3572021.1 phosphoenolpyruvate--protein phosphotransferase [Paenibacillus phoenicis]